MATTKPTEISNAFSCTSYGITDVGKARKHNEDSMLDRSEIGLWIVADGMGGHDAGDVASQLIVSSLKKVHEGVTLNRYIDDIEDRLLKVNQQLIDKANEFKKLDWLILLVLIGA